MEEYHLAWLHLTLGADFIDELEVLADNAMQDTAQPKSAWLQFPDHPLPKLSIVQLDGKPAYLGVDDGETPWWMVPTAAWQHGQVPPVAVDAPVKQKQSSSKQGVELLAAEHLKAEFGHVEKGRKSKRRKRLL